MNDDLHLGPDGTELCHHYEAVKLLAYPDPGSPLFKALVRGGISPYTLTVMPPGFAGLSGAPWTIGWGDTGPGVVCGLRITAEEADERFARRMAREFEPGVRRAVRVALDQREFDALCSIFYNCGVGNMTGSTLVRKLNAGDRMAAAAEFPKWNKSGGTVWKGLQRRRHAEMIVFRGGAAAVAIAQAEGIYK